MYVQLVRMLITYVALPTFALHMPRYCVHCSRYPLPAGPQQQSCSSSMRSPMGQRDIWMDARQFHRPCSTYCVGSANYTFIVQYYFMQSFIFHHMQSGPTLSVPLQTLPVSTELSTCSSQTRHRGTFLSTQCITSTTSAVSDICQNAVPHPSYSTTVK